MRSFVLEITQIGTDLSLIHTGQVGLVAEVAKSKPLYLNFLVHCFYLVSAMTVIYAITCDIVPSLCYIESASLERFEL